MARWLIFCISFLVDVRVHAADVRIPLTNPPVQFPENCLLAKTSGCALQTRDHEGFYFIVEGGEIRLEENTVAMVSWEKSELTLVKGWVWVRSTSLWRVRTEFGSVEGEGSFWVHRNTRQVFGLAYLNEITMESRLGEKIRVLPGQSNWMGRPTRKGETLSGAPTPIDYRQQVARVARLYLGNMKAFEAEMKEFSKVWKSAVEMAADLSRDNSQRRIAMIADQKQEAERLRLQLEQDRLRRRQLMFRKIYLDQ